MMPFQIKKMGIVKQKMLDDDYNQELIDFLKEVVDREEISGTPLGIAKQALDKGVNSMSNKQLNVIEKFIRIYQKENECEICLNANIGSFTDSIYVVDFGSCPTCEYSREKFMAD